MIGFAPAPMLRNCLKRFPEVASRNPILEKSCVQNCHGTVTAGSGRPDFRLDVYADQGTVPGAKSKAIDALLISANLAAE